MSDLAYSRTLIDGMNQYYDARAPWHDKYMGYESIEGMEKLLAPVIKAFEEMMIGRKVLEIACGTGNWTQVLAKRAESVVAIDKSPTVLEIASKKLEGYSNISIMAGDAYNLDDIGDSFDLVFAADWWSHIPKRMLSLFMDSVMRKLHPGSQAVFIDMSFKKAFREETSFFDSDNNRVSLRELPDGSTCKVVKNFPSESELREFLTAYADNIGFYEFESLKRWGVAFET